MDICSLMPVLDSCSYVPMFGETEYDPSRCIPAIRFEEQLDALGRAVDSGKVGNGPGKMIALLLFVLCVNGV